MAPLWFSSYVFELRVPHVSLTVENIADFVSAYILGNLLQMAFRFWAFRRWVFPDEFGRDPDKARRVHVHRGRHRRGDGGGARGITSTTLCERHAAARPTRRRQRLPVDRLSDSSPPRVSKTS